MSEPPTDYLNIRLSGGIRVDLRVILQSGMAAGTGAPAALALALAPGRVLAARVVGFQDGRVLLDLAGEIRPATSLVPLAAGDLLKVRVVRVTGGEILLKVLGDEGKALPGDPLAGALRGLGILPTEDALQAAQGLITAGQPVTAAGVRAVMAVLRRYPGAPDQTAAAAALLLGRRLPPIEPLLSALRFYAQEAAPFGALAAALEEAFGALPGRPASQPGAANALPTALPTEWVSVLRGILKGLTLPATPAAVGPQPSAEALAQQLGEAVRFLGMDYEREWVRQWVGQPGADEAAPSPSAGAPTAPLQAPPGTPTNLKGVLLAIRHVLRASAGDPAAVEGEGHPAQKAYKQALARAEEALHTITAWQVLSSEPEEGGAPERQTVVFQLPVAFGGGVGTLDVMVERRPQHKGGQGGGEGDQTEAGREDPGAGGYAVRLRLSPPHLGDVRVDLFLQKKRLALSFAVLREPSLAALEEGGPALGERLRRRGFQVEGIRFRPLAVDEGPGNASGAPPPPGTGIDLIV